MKTLITCYRCGKQVVREKNAKYCVECAKAVNREKSRRYYRENCEHCREVQNRYYAENKAAFRARRQKKKAPKGNK